MLLHLSGRLTLLRSGKTELDEVRASDLFRYICLWQPLLFSKNAEGSWFQRGSEQFHQVSRVFAHLVFTAFLDTDFVCYSFLEKLTNVTLLEDLAIEQWTADGLEGKVLCGNSVIESPWQCLSSSQVSVGYPYHRSVTVVFWKFYSLLNQCIY